MKRDELSAWLIAPVPPVVSNQILQPSFQMWYFCLGTLGSPYWVHSEAQNYLQYAEWQHPSCIWMVTKNSTTDFKQYGNLFICNKIDFKYTTKCIQKF